MTMETRPVSIIRQAGREHEPIAVKDPSVVALPDGSYIMYATVCGACEPDYRIGRFSAEHPGGPWTELEPPVIHGLQGPEVCAPSVTYDGRTGLWTLYVQTSFLHENGIIASATSSDGIDFVASAEAAMRRENIPAQNPMKVVGLYDVAVSDVCKQGENYECMVFSGYRHFRQIGERRAGCGDLYVAMRPKSTPRSAWGTPALACRQEDVPFHNAPASPQFEWGLEGGKIVQLADDAFLLIGVCFLDKSLDEAGTRQRVFLACSRTAEGPYKAMRPLVEPVRYPEGQGENGHPDIIDGGKTLGILYQERAGADHPWHLRYGELKKSALLQEITATLQTPVASPPPPEPRP